MNILVTGGAGYIGSVLVGELVAIGHEVAVIDDLSLGHREAVHDSVPFFEGSLEDIDFVDETLSTVGPEAVIHFASRSSVSESHEQPFRYLDSNVRMGLNLFDSMIRHKVLRLVLSSTACLFSKPKRIPIREDEAIVPGNPYGEAKYYLERSLYWLEKTHGMRYAALRYFNAAGATQECGEDHSPETHLIPLVLQVASGQREHIAIYGDRYSTPDGTCIRDYIHVRDLADAHIRVLPEMEHRSCAYNLGTGKGWSVRQVIDTAREVTGRSIPCRVDKPRPGDAAELVACSDKIREELGWTAPHSDLENCIATAWAWHQTNPSGYPIRPK